MLITLWLGNVPRNRRTVILLSPELHAGTSIVLPTTKKPVHAVGKCKLLLNTGLVTGIVISWQEYLLVAANRRNLCLTVPNVLQRLLYLLLYPIQITALLEVKWVRALTRELALLLDKQLPLSYSICPVFNLSPSILLTLLWPTAVPWPGESRYLVAATIAFPLLSLTELFLNIKP